MQNTSRTLIASDRIYCFLLLAYPRSFRLEWGADMAQVFRDECRAGLEHYGLIGLMQIWLSTLYDWLTTAFEQHIEEAFHMSGQTKVIRLGALAALAGGMLGIYLVTQGPNSYGNYSWHGWLAPVAATLFALGLGGGVAAYKQQLNSLGWFGVMIAISGLLLMAVGHASDTLWFFIFIGPIIIVPIGSIIFGISIYRSKSLPIWWRLFPFVICVIAMIGFGIELFEEFTGNSTPDRGLQMAESLFSLAWIGLGIGLWLNYEELPKDPQLTA